MSLIDLTIQPRDKNIGGFAVRRILPYAKRRMVGPFIFLDHMGPAHFDAGNGFDVAPHPHIGLSTVTYLFAGEMMHRDSAGSLQKITPGDVNWMTAGRGITHSERMDEGERSHPHDIHGLQSWVALPVEAEEIAPEFFHHAADTLPLVKLPGVVLRIIAGEAYGQKSPVKIHSPLFYIEAHMDAGSELEMPQDYAERAAYLIDGDVSVETNVIAERNLAVFIPHEHITLTANKKSHLMLLGGEPFPEARHIWWNFVSSRPERIEQAKRDWKESRFPPINGETEYIPLPE